MKVFVRLTIIFSAVVSVFSACAGNGKADHYYCSCSSAEDIDAYFKYVPGDIIISGHRGGNMPGYPENCIETFDAILAQMPTFYEIDPRMTKDSVVVLMHDATLDRTTTGKGKVRDYTYEELRQFYLVDKWGNVTGYRIPSVADVVQWSQGKTILNFDIKDVARDVLVPLVNSLGAKNCIYTVRNAEEALTVYNLDSEARMSAWVRDIAQLKEYGDAGIPMKNIVIAYVVADKMNPDNKELYDALHAAGIRCMVSTSPVQDRAVTGDERLPLFKEVVATAPDIIETDFPTEFIGLYE